MTAAESLREGGFPYSDLSEGEVRIALHVAVGYLLDRGLLDDFAAHAEEDIAEARGQAREP